MVIPALIAAAAQARQRGHGGEELRLLNQALEKDAAHPQALNARGMRALADHDGLRARALFTAATDAHPREPALWMNRATACRLLSDDVGEQESLERALDLDRLHFMAQLRMAELNQRTGKIREAVQSWRGVIQMANALGEIPLQLRTTLDAARSFLAEQTEFLAVAIDRDIGSAIGDAGPEGSRFAACVNNVLGRRAIYNNQCAGIHFPFLPAIEFFDRSQFSWIEALEAKTEMIRREAVTLIETRMPHVRPYVSQELGTPENKWSPLDNSLDWGACFLWEFGERNDAVCDLCPQTAAALAAIPQTDIPGKAPSAFFSLLRPHAHIPAHTGVTNTRTIIHLPLVVPQGCRFRVGGETREWNAGEAFAFDDTIEHEAWNDSDELRVVLIFDVWNPYLTAIEQKLLRDFFAIVENN